MNQIIYGIVYCIRNTKNNKVYFGITTKDKGFNSRFCCKGCGIERVAGYFNKCKMNGRSYNIKLLKDINDFGNGVWEVNECFDTAKSRKELMMLESIYIKVFQAYDSRYGYNYNWGKNRSVQNGNKNRKLINKDKCKDIIINNSNQYIKKVNNLSELGKGNINVIMNDNEKISFKTTQDFIRYFKIYRNLVYRLKKGAVELKRLSILRKSGIKTIEFVKEGIVYNVDYSKKIINPNSKEVIIKKENGEKMIFTDAAECGEYLKVKHNCIIQWCNGTRNINNSAKFKSLNLKYIGYKDGELQVLKEQCINKYPKSKKVIVKYYSGENQIFKSVHECSEILKINRRLIGYWLKRAGNFTKSKVLRNKGICSLEYI